MILTAAATTTAVPITTPVGTTVTMETDPMIDPCQRQPCLNSGTCIGGFSQSSSGYICLCVEQYTGMNCDIKVETATSKICSYQHICMKTSLLM